MKSPQEHEAVISGVSGLFPDSHDVTEFLQKLYDGVDMMNHSFKPDTYDENNFPTKTGVLPKDFEFDNTFFALPTTLSCNMDASTCIAMPCAFGAIIDSGINPAELWGTNTAVISVSGHCELDHTLFHTDEKRTHVIDGISRAMQANRISFYLNLKGPSYSLTTSWIGVIQAMVTAKELIASGRAPAVIITANNLINTSAFHCMYDRFGVLSPNCETKSFSEDADGYARSETSVALLIQRKSEARRIYAEVVGLLAEDLGSKSARFTDTGEKESMVTMLKELYDKCGVDPAQVAYVEGSGMASKRVDAVELNSLAEVLIKPGRRRPLLVGSVKSNAGHAEGAADGLAILKTLLAANYDLIPRNLHFSRPNSDVPALLEGTMKVVTENTKLEGDLLAVNAFNMVHSMAHLILRRHPSTSTNVPTEVGVLPEDGLPRLFVMSGRNLDKTLDSLSKEENQPIDPNYIALSHRLFKNGIKGHIHRAYTVLNDAGLVRRETYDFFAGTKPPPLWFVFTGMGSQWVGMGLQLMKVPTVARAIHRCHDLLKPKGLDLIEIVTSLDKNIFNNILHSFVGIAAIQIGLVDLLYEVGIRPDGIIGHSVGELGCAYADGCFTAEQTILAAYARGKASLDATLIPGMMAAVGMGYQEIKNMLPDDIEVACHNSSTSCTLSGPAESVAKVVESLTSKNIFAKLVNASNIAYHSQYIKPAAPYLLSSLEEVIPSPKRRSKKWISTSIPEKDWDSELAKYTSPEYHANNLLSAVLFEEASAHVPKDAILVEIAPHGLLQAILKRAFPEAQNIPLTSSRAPDNLVFLFEAFGKLYNRGLTFDLEKLYPPVQFPVPRGTRSLSPLVNWTGRLMPKPFIPFSGYRDEVCRRLKTVILDEELKNLNEYIVKGVSVIPFSVYVGLRIDDFRSSRIRQEKEDLRFIRISNMRLHQLLQIVDDKAELFCGFGRNFEVSQNEKEVFSSIPKEDVSAIRECEELPNWEGIDISVEDIYQRLEATGLHLGRPLKLITSLNEGNEGIRATINWNENFPSFLESCLLLPVIASRPEEFSIVTRIDDLFLDFNQFLANKSKVITVEYQHNKNAIRAEGLTIINPTVQCISVNEVNPYVFIQPTLSPCDLSNVKEVSEFLSVAKDMIISNIQCNFLKNETLYIINLEDEIDIQKEIRKAFKDALGMRVKIMNLQDDNSFPLDLLKDKYSLIISCSNHLKNTKALMKFKKTFLLLKNEVVPQGLQVILSKRIENDLYSLCIEDIEFDGSSPLISLSCNDWLTKLQLELKDDTNSSVYLVGSSITLEEMSYLHAKCSEMPNSNKIRYIFHDSPFHPQHHIDQLRKDMRVNVYCNDDWAVLKPNIVNFTSQPFSSYTFSRLRNYDIEINALGLTLEDCNLTPKLDVIEYSGVRGGKAVCGIGYINEETLLITPDPVLCWEKPENWTDEEVTSCLLPYTLGYYLFTQYTDSLYNMFVLKHPLALVYQGHLSISQAVINLALQNKFNVFTTYQTDEERNIIKKLFPQIPKGNILNYEDSEDTLSKVARRSEGFGFILNTFPETESLRRCILLLGEGGCVFRATSVDRVNKPLGLYDFLRSLCVSGIIPSTLKEMNNEQKETLRAFVERGFNEEQIKPMSHNSLAKGTTNQDVIELLRDPNMKKRLIVSMNTDVQYSRQYHATPDTTHLIVANENTTSLFNIVEWLIKRDALNINIVVNFTEKLKYIYQRNILRMLGSREHPHMTHTFRYNPHFISITYNGHGMYNAWYKRLEQFGTSIPKKPLLGMIQDTRGVFRLKIIMTKNPHVSFNLESSEILRNDKLKTYIHELKFKGNLSFVLISGDLEDSKLSVIIEEASGSKIIYIHPKLNSKFQLKIKNGLEIVDNNRLSYGTFHNILDSLIKYLGKLLYVSNKISTSSSFVSEFLGKANTQLPMTVQEVVELSRQSVGWKEVRTLSLPWSSCKESPPVFVIPSLMKHTFEPLFSNLFFPVFVACIPRRKSVQEIAQLLYEDYKKFDLSVFNLICTDLNYKLGLLLSKMMEENGKRVVLTVIDTSFDWKMHPLLKHSEKCVLSNAKELEIPRNKERLVETGLKIMKERIHLFTTDHTSLLERKLKGMVVLIQLNSKSLALQTELQQHSKSPINVVETAMKGIFQEMITSKDIINVINTAVLPEIKDCATRCKEVTNLKLKLLAF